MKVKVLIFVDRLLVGGIQVFIKNVIEHIDREKFQIELLVLDDGNEYPLETTLKKQGIIIHKLDNVWIRHPQDLITHSKEIKRFFKEHNDYSVVHMNSGSKNYPVLKYAKQYGIPMRIAHSHNIDFQTSSKSQKLLGNYMKFYLKKYATDYFGCSKKAGEWLFGKKIVKQQNFKVIPNAIDYELFKPNINMRDEIRSMLNVSEDELVLGHVGRFTHQKNHEFLIEIFKSVLQSNPKAKLLLVGEGELQESIKKRVNELEIEEKVIFAGFQKNVNEYMQAMDVFVFPSKFEGLGIVLIEAQANGMLCFASENVIPDEAKVSSVLEFISLEESYEYWAKKILMADNFKKNTFQEIKNKGYIIEDMVQVVEKLYEL